jgi:hypothetical protein
VTRREAVPALLLLAYGVWFASRALGAQLLVFDDHPGQLFRAWHVVARGAAPWAWEPGWWTGYPELQFYPPGLAYAGALLHRLSLGTLPLAAAYQTLLWLAYLAPGVTTFVLLARITRSGWAALPAAFVVLTFAGGAPGIASGVEGGVHIGMVGARLAWALLPLLLLVLLRWIEEAGRLPWLLAPLVAAIVLTHPAALPAAVVLTLLAAHAAAPRGARLSRAFGGLALAAGLTAFWTLPLVLRLEHTRALAWGELSLAGLARAFATQPLLPVLVAAAVLAVFARRDPSAPGTRSKTVVARFLPAMIGVTLTDRVVLEPMGIRWLPADRVADGAWLALLLAAGLGWARVCRRVGRDGALSLGALALVVLLSLPGGTLVLVPQPAEWPKLEATVRGLRLEHLWDLLRRAPDGRILFFRSSVPLVHETAWWRPHTHILALTPMTTGRAIVNGTFTHPSPVAALVYRGDAGPGALTSLAETRDGVSLFGRSLATLDADAFNARAERLAVSAVVVLEDDLPGVRALEDNPVFPQRLASPPFVVFQRSTPVELPRELDPCRWTFQAPGEGWIGARLAYYPLWTASAGGAPLAVRRGRDGGLEVRAPRRGATIELAYRPGLPEKLGLVVSGGAILVCAALARRRRAIPVPPCA